MNIQLSQASCGSLIIASDRPFPYQIRHVEYHRDQRLIMLVYNHPEDRDDLMHYEVPDKAVTQIEANPNIMIIDYGPNKKLYGYDVPLVRVGDMIAEMV